jgi:tight adherence protein B
VFQPRVASIEPEQYISAALAARKLATLVRAGLTLGKARQQLISEIGQLDATVQAQLANLMSMAERYGSSLSWALGALSNHYFQQAQLLRRIKQAAAMPKATAKLVGWLPILCLIGAQVFGLAPIGTILHNLVAGASAVFGLILLLLNRVAMNRLIRGLEQTAAHGLAAVTGFAEIALALQAGLPPARLAELEMPTGLSELLRFASASGSSVGDLVQGELEVRYLTFVAEVELQAEKLQVRLLAPMGFLVLPAMILLAIIPTAITLITN